MILPSGVLRAGNGGPRVSENVEIGWKRRARAYNAARLMCCVVCADFGWWRRNWLLTFRLERFVQGGQILCEQLIEFFCRVGKLSLERVDVSDLVTARFSFVTEDRAVKLVGVLTQPFFAGDRAAFSGSDDFLAHAINFSIEIADVFTNRIAFWQCCGALGQRFSQRNNPFQQRPLPPGSPLDPHTSLDIPLPTRFTQLRPA